MVSSSMAGCAGEKAGEEMDIFLTEPLLTRFDSKVASRLFPKRMRVAAGKKISTRPSNSPLTDCAKRNHFG